MAKQDYLPNRDNDKAVWLANFVEKLKLHDVLLGISAATITQLETDRDVFASALVVVESFRTAYEGIVIYKNRLRDSKEPLGVPPSAPTIPPIPPDIQGNIFGRIRILVQTIKLNPNYTETIGDELGIIGEASEPIDPSTLKPVLKTQIYTDGHPLIIWHKGQSDGIAIKVDRGNGAGYEPLATDSHPNYLDTHPLPPFGQSVIWKYTAIYLQGDAHIGLWSEPVSITVSGQP